MGFFGGLQAESYDRKYDDRELLRRMVAYFGRHRRRLIVISFTLLTIAGVSAATPILVSRGVDLMAEQDSPQFILALTGALFLMGVAIWAVNWVRRVFVMRTVGDVMMELRQDAFAASVGHDLSFYDEFASGRIVSRITSDTQDFAQVVILITDLLSQIVQSAILLMVLLGIEWRLTLWVLVFLPIVFGFSSLLRRLARVVTRQGFRAMANVNADI